MFLRCHRSLSRVAQYPVIGTLAVVGIPTYVYFYVLAVGTHFIYLLTIGKMYMYLLTSSYLVLVVVGRYLHKIPLSST